MAETESDAVCPGCAGAWDEPPWIGCTRPWHHASEWADIFEDAPTPPALAAQPSPASPDTEGGADRMTHPHVVTVRAYLDNAGITPETLRYAATHEALCRSWIFDLLNGLADVMDDAPSPDTVQTGARRE